MSRAAVLTGAAMGVAALCMLLSAGSFATAGVVVVGALLLAAFVRARGADPALAGIVALGYGARLVAMLTVHDASVAAGGRGHVLGDERNYADVAANVARLFRGEPAYIAWVGAENLLSAFTYIEAGLFYVFGPDVTIVKALNCFLGTALAVLAYEVAREWCGRRAGLVAAALTASFPSLFLWSILNLKDVAAVTLGMFVIAVTTRIVGAPVRGLVLLYGSLTLFGDVRTFLTLALGWLIPPAVALQPWRSPTQRVSVAAIAFVCSAVLLLVLGHGLYGSNWIGARALQFAEVRRAYGALGARTALEETPVRVRPPAYVEPGDRLLVYDLLRDDLARPSTSRRPEPTPSGVTHEAPPGTTVALLSPDASAPPSAAGRLYVRDGDVIRVTGGPPATGPPTILALRSGDENARELLPIAGAADLGGLFARIAIALPLMLVAAIASPFPWRSQTALDLATIPEMACWYVALAASVAGALRGTPPVRKTALAWAYVGLVTVGLALLEGNVGTLLRHRSEIQPVIFALAAGTLVAWSDALLRRRGSEASERA